MSTNPYRATQAFSIFLSELSVLGASIEKLQKNTDQFSTECAALQTIFHRVKGVAGMFGYEELGLKAAQLEDLCKKRQLQPAELEKLLGIMLASIYEVLKLNTTQIDNNLN